MKNLSKSKNYEEAQAYSNVEKLPIGAYVLKIQKVKYEEGQNGMSDVIVFAFDIEQGDFKDFFRRNFEGQTQEDKKWKGTYRLYVPKDDGSEQDTWTTRRFKTVMNNFEESNTGYVWNWDEKTLEGKLIGAIFNEKEYDFNGRHGFFTNCYSLVSTTQVTSGSCKIPEPTMLKGNSQATTTDSSFLDKNGEEELPF